MDPIAATLLVLIGISEIYGAITKYVIWKRLKEGKYTVIALKSFDDKDD